MVALTNRSRLRLAACDGRPNPDPVPPAGDGPDPVAPARHTPDFSLVGWGQILFTFSAKQRRVVRALWEALVSGQVYVGQARLLAIADSDGVRLHDLFRRHAAWGTLIRNGPSAGGPVGTYRLSPDLTPGGEFPRLTGEPAAPAGGPSRG